MSRRAVTGGDVKDRNLASGGKLRIEWASREMPVLRLIRKRFASEKPLRGARISACLHITTETANLALTLKDGGAELALCASNPLSTQDDVAAALVGYGIPTYAIKGEDEKTYYRHIESVLKLNPHITLDDGADLVSSLHKGLAGRVSDVIGGMEETTTGIIRLRSMAKQRRLKYPIIAVNDAETKHLFDNRYGTGQSTVDGITRATNVLWAGKKVVVCGYGWCGRGIAMRARGMGAQVIVIEVNPIRALEAVMDGYEVMPLTKAARIGDIFVTITGGLHTINKAHLQVMKDGAILANSGHFNVEINIEALKALSVKEREIRPFVREYTMGDGRRLYLLAEGRLINLSAAEGHPASVMDMSFANQALCAEHMFNLKSKMAPGVYPVPRKIDEEVGRLKLHSMGVDIDKLSREQRKYLGSWELGT